MTPRSESLALLIPTFQAHVHFLADLLHRTSEQTLLPRWVIVSASSIEPASAAAEELDRLAAMTWPFELRILQTPEFAYASRNRNIAADEAIRLGATILSFFDGDDIPHPRRLEAIQAAFDSTGGDVVIHSFFQGEWCQEPLWPDHPPFPESIEDSYSYKKEFLTFGLTGRKLEVLRADFFNVNNESCPTTAGHISLRASRFHEGLRFQEHAYGYEDALILSDCLKAGMKPVLLPYPYSYYAVAAPPEQNQKWAWIESHLRTSLTSLK